MSTEQDPRLNPVVRASASTEPDTKAVVQAEREQSQEEQGELWVVEVIGPFGDHEEMVTDLKAKVFPEREIKMLAVTDGKREVRAM